MVFAMPIDPVSLGIGAAGTLLGVLNYWRAWEKDRVRLRVRAGISITVGMMGPEKSIFIEVLNLSNFPITITSTVFQLDGSDLVLHLIPPYLNDERLPKRLDPRDAVTIYARPIVLKDSHVVTIKDVIARTACGAEVKGGRKARSGILQIQAVGREIGGEH